MTYTFDGTNDNISFGSDASIDNFTSKSVLAYADGSGVTTGDTDAIVAKSDGAGVNPTGWQFNVQTTAVTDPLGHMIFTHDFSVADGTWITANDTAYGTTNTEARQWGVTYNRSSTANDPVIYINGSSSAVTETSTPAGTANTDAAASLRVGENDGGGNDWGGNLGFLVMDNTILTAADVNRHRWWGVAPGGPSTVDVWQPMWTSDLNNKGTATANGTATGAVPSTSADRFVRVERMWGSMMGCGR